MERKTYKLNTIINHHEKKKPVKSETSSFTYVDIVTKGCAGWLNLFFKDRCIAMVENVEIANMIRDELKEKKTSVVTGKAYHDKR